MSEGVLIAIITGVFTLTGISLTLYVSWRLNKVEKKINGRMDELLILTRKSSQAEGNLEGREELKKEQEDNL